MHDHQTDNIIIMYFSVAAESPQDVRQILASCDNSNKVDIDFTYLYKINSDVFTTDIV